LTFTKGEKLSSGKPIFEDESAKQSDGSVKNDIEWKTVFSKKKLTGN